MFDITNLLYIEQISPVPWHFVKSRFHCIVVSTDPPWCFVTRFSGSQLRASSCKVKLSECYAVPPSVILFQSPRSFSSLARLYYSARPSPWFPYWRSPFTPFKRGAQLQCANPRSSLAILSQFSSWDSWSKTSKTAILAYMSLSFILQWLALSGSVC